MGVFIQFLKKYSKGLSKSLSLEEETNRLSNRVTKLETQNEILKFVIALQDFNRYYELEKHGIQNIYKLKQQRESISNYIFQDCEGNDLIDFKISIASIKLKSMSKDCAEHFERKFGKEFIASIVTYCEGKVSNINAIKTNLSDSEIKEADEWWEYPY